MVLKGQVQVFREQGEQETEVAILGPGEYFGEMALLQRIRRTASIRAITPVDILATSRADFTALAASSTHFSELLAGVMQQRMSDGDVEDAS